MTDPAPPRGPRPPGRGDHAPAEAQPHPGVAQLINLAERQSTERQTTERQPTERQTTERQPAERQAAERQITERQITERQAAERQAAERQIAERRRPSPQLPPWPAPEGPEPWPEPVSAPDPAAADATAAPSADPQARARWIGQAMLLVALGVLGQAWVGYQGRITGASSSLLWYGTLCLIFTPSAALVMSRRLSDKARVWFTLYMSVALLATRFILYPSQFAYHDELINYRVLLSIDRSGHLFTPNSLLPAVADYPGMQIATATVSHLTGLSLHSAGLVILLAVRVVMTLALIRIVQIVSKSAPVGCLAALIYATNPQYIFFNSQFSYQSVALPLTFFCIYVFVSGRRTGNLLSLLPAAAVLLAVAATHHLTSLGLVVVIWIWYAFTKVAKRPVSGLLPLALISLVIVAAWTWLARSVIVPYISEILQNSAANIANLASGRSDHKLFTDSAGDHNPLWQAVLSIASVLIIVSTLIPALWLASIKHRLLSAAAMTLFLIAAVYPMIPAGHLTNATAEVSDRASGFVFVGLGYLVAIWWFRDVPFHRHARTSRFTVARRTWLLVLGLTVCFVGGTIIGSGPDWLHGPGPYLVSADNRSVDQLALQAARWEGQHLPAGSRVFSDRVNDLLAAVYGNQHVVTSLGDGIKEGSVSTLLLEGPTPADADVACQADVNFLIADQRLATSLPHVGVYIDKGEYQTGARATPPAPGDLVKFDDVPGAQRIFDNGAIRIFDLRGLLCAGGK